jgi:hypothetical protein
MHVDAMLADLARPEGLPALLSAIDHLGPNASRALGGWPRHPPWHALVKLGKPSPETEARLVRALDHEDFRVSCGAAMVFAEMADDDALFQHIWSRRDLARSNESYAMVILRAAEVRRDPVMREYLLWMEGDKRFRSVGMIDRIGEALARLRQ